jgi:DNA modification methylase
MIKTIPISKLKTNNGQIEGLPKNPRFIRDERFDKLKQSIKELPSMLELRELIVYPQNGHFVTIGGNMRLRAAKDLGLTELPCKVLDKETPVEMLAEIAIKDNVGFGSDDYDILANEWTDFPLADWGMELPEVEDVTEPQDAEPQIDKAAELNKKWKVKTGDLWQIGEHRLLCGDSTKREDVERVTQGKADCVFTDPPYSSGGYQESGKVSGSIGARGGKTIANDNLSTRGYRNLMVDALALVPSAHSAFIFCDWKMWIETFDIAERSGFKVRNMLVWDKQQMGMGMPFRNQHELVLFASKIAGKIGDGATPNVLQYSRDNEADHHTPKPPELIATICKQVDFEAAYDPFVGGGSTLVACQNLNRKCYAIEISENYCAVILERMQTAFPDIEIKRLEDAKAAS